ncbi:molybdopterin-dependent oxidoreductase [uncultured Enterovirga sp.]|uniref:molybdopterin-dependent oxidoreductase n=1 Tax=uncultured Enterovirga sp. TaxID=2026352 RepID=UPI0035C99319
MLTGTLIRKSACPHDCPSACSLEVEVLDGDRIGRVRGSRSNSYTAGVVCAKVARYAERVEHPDRLTQPLRRTGPKGSGQFAPISWDEALDEIAAEFIRAEERWGPEAVWPYHSGGNMGIVQRWGLDRLRNVKRYSRQQTTICVTPAESGWKAGVGKLVGPDPREMAEADLIVSWGGNPVSTQVNVMTHVSRARKRGGVFAVVDVYRTPTVEAADVALIVRPGTDAALALGMMHVLFAEGMVDRDYLARLTDFDDEVERHIRERDPAWAAAITGLRESEIVDFARLFGRTKRSFLRVGFGFTRTRNGAAAMHAVSCLPAVTGAWTERGGGAFFLSFDKETWGIDTTLIHGLDAIDPHVRILDQSRIGAVLTGEPEALKGGPPVTAMLMQNANSVVVAPSSAKVREGLSRDDLFLAVHEQFMTPTARFADIVLPATTFVEQDDMYFGLGHTYLTHGPQIVPARGETRSNHDVVCGLASRLGAEHPGFRMSAAELLDDGLQRAGLPSLARVAEDGFLDRAQLFDTAHFLNGFPQPGGRFRFKPDWASVGPDHARMPRLPDWSADYERTDETHPYKLVCPPARNFLNSTFTETPTSQAREVEPRVRMHPDAALSETIVAGDSVRVGNARGSVLLRAEIDPGQQADTLVVEGIWPDEAFAERRGINHLIGDDAVPPNGGAAFHDIAVYLTRETSAAY